MSNPLHDAVDRLAGAARDFLKWLVLLVVSPTGFSVVSWWRNRKGKNVKPGEETSKVVPRRRWLTREERKRRREER